MTGAYEIPASIPVADRADFETAWKQHLAESNRRYTDPECDRAFWADHAEDYESRFVGEPEGIERIESMVEPSDRVLEIGPGTGRYTRRLAELAAHVTAIEDSPAMCAELDRQLEAADRRENVTIRETAWEDVSIDQHDVVVAAWSLYRQPEIGRCLDRIVTAAGTGFVIVDSPGALPPHKRLLATESTSQLPPVARPALYFGVLATRGVYPTIDIETKTRVRRAASRAELLGALLGDGVTEPSTYADALDPWIEDGGDEWRYRYRLPAAVISWERNAAIESALVGGDDSSVRVE